MQSFRSLFIFGTSTTIDAQVLFDVVIIPSSSNSVILPLVISFFVSDIGCTAAFIDLGFPFSSKWQLVSEVTDKSRSLIFQIVGYSRQTWKNVSRCSVVQLVGLKWKLIFSELHR